MEFTWRLSGAHGQSMWKNVAKRRICWGGRRLESCIMANRTIQVYPCSSENHQESTARWVYDNEASDITGSFLESPVLKQPHRISDAICQHSTMPEREVHAYAGPVTESRYSAAMKSLTSHRTQPAYHDYSASTDRTLNTARGCRHFRMSKSTTLPVNEADHSTNISASKHDHHRELLGIET
ncbi:uncharacterized protein EI97DRAFT_221427 [Westerdykella ornata]|uniref:Uncharacterized protein n=1 Tax=Westerdykella ornata TaxID=318751 RepID=A0A6A6JUY1_WESOR|nr:uncharacterized protein EI97DRAFT_221427 [Westerdykella ornata]KAF2278849.1 hypothetical protein EI97DRAFT_221427 [Westerdykella ornata]